MSMKQELAALKKKRDAGDITAFKYRQGVRQIKKSYGVDAPSNVTKIFRALTTPSPRSAKAVAAKKKASKNRSQSQGGRSRDQVIEERQESLARKSAEQGGGAVLSNKKKKRAAPKFNPSGLKVPAKKKAKTAAKSKTAMYYPLNPKTGKADTSKPKVSVAVRLKQEDRYKTRKMVETAAKSSMNKKKKGK